MVYFGTITWRELRIWSADQHTARLSGSGRQNVIIMYENKSEDNEDETTEMTTAKTINLLLTNWHFN